MSEWVPMPSEVWPIVADRLPHPWPKPAVQFDLQWWAAQVQAGLEPRIPSHRKLAARWGWGEKKAYLLLQTEGGTP